MHSTDVLTDERKVEVDLSVIIIAKNEEEMIGSCIESAIRALEYAKQEGKIRTYEVVLSDSASTDETVGIAEEYPIKIVQLKPSWPLSASAGRYIGYLNTDAEFVFFLDGDCVVHEKWFARALPYHKDPGVAAVEGFFDEYIEEDNFFHDIIKGKILSQRVARPTSVENVGGPAIFKTSVLDEVGGYNPYLRGGEDRDLSYRILAAGYELLRIPEPSYVHYWAKKSGKIRFLTLLRSTFVWSIGDGQSTRVNFTNPLVRRKQRQRYFRWGVMRGYLPGLAALLLLQLNILGFALFFSDFTVVALLSDILFFVIVGFEKRLLQSSMSESLYRLFQLVPYTLIRHAGFFLGLLRRLPDPSEYPTDALVLRTQSCAGLIGGVQNQPR